MPLNPTKSKQQKEWKDENVIGLEGALVTETRSHTEGDNVSHAVYVRPDTMDRSIIADVAISQTGDVTIPIEGSRVVIGYRVNERPLVLGQRYKKDDTIPDFEPGERIIGHPLSDSYIKLTKDGSVDITDDSDNTITLSPNDSITIEDGSNNTISLTFEDNITIDGYGGNSIELQSNGDIVINGGSTKAITDVTIDSTNEYGGATSLDITRSDSVYIPSE